MMRWRAVLIAACVVAPALSAFAETVPGPPNPGPTLQPGPTVVDLVKQLKEGDKTQRDTAAQVLGKMGSDDPAVMVIVTPVLADAMVRDAEPGIRSRAAEGLGLIGKKAKDPQQAIVPSLIPGLRDSEAYVRKMVATALGGIGAGAAAALPNLKELVEKDPDPDVKKAAEEAVKAIQPQEVAP